MEELEELSWLARRFATAPGCSQSETKAEGSRWELSSSRQR